MAHSMRRVLAIAFSGLLTVIPAAANTVDQGPLYPGKPAGIKQAQADSQSAITGIGAALAVLGIGLALAFGTEYSAPSTAPP